MKTIDEFLSYLRHLDVKLWTDGDRLRYSASNGTLTPTLLAQLRERKSEILAFLQKANLASNSNFDDLRPVPRNADLPLSFAQQRLWFLNQLEGGNAYNTSVALQLTGYLQVTVLERSLKEIVRRHEALRTNFAVVDGSPIQVIAPPTPVTLAVIDLQALPKAEQSLEVQRLAYEKAQYSFNFKNESLLRATLLQLSDQKHVLLLVMHHIVFDGWSTGILLRELSTLYEAFSKGEASPLPELPIQYADFAVWQRQWLSGEVLQTQLNYWKQQLAGALPLLELPTDRPRPSVQTFRGNTYYFQLNADLTQKLKSLSQKSGATLFISLLTAFNILLSRYSGQSDIIVGSPIANRNHSEIESLIGFFVNTLVLRTNLEGNPSFLELLSRVRQVALDAYAHQDLPFDKLVEELQPERSLSYSPLFQVMFALQNAPIEKLEMPGLSITSLQLENVTSKFDLSLSMEETGQELRGAWEYNTDLFDATTIARMTGHFQTLLEGIVANPEQGIFELSLLNPTERHQLLTEWNDTQREYPQDKCIHQLFEAQAEQTPNAVAVVFKNQQLTYRELNNRANQLAYHLQTLGVAPEVLVGICVTRSIEMMVGLLGILKAGGAYVPLDPAYPQERLALMLEDSQLSVILTQSHLHTGLPDHPAQVICLDSDWETIAQEGDANLDVDFTPDNLAYIIYTSGSTGKPKGVQIFHQGVVNFLTSMRQEPGLTAEDVLVAVTTISFDIAVLEVFLPITVGARVVLVSREVAADATQLIKVLEESGATVMQATPATWRMLLAAGWQGKENLTILCGGEAMPRSLANQLLSRSAAVWNMYGPTETTIWSAVERVEPGDTPVLIGRAIANTTIYLIDTNSYQNDAAIELVPVGVAGELLIGGAGLARGYLNRSELTAEKFIPDPFSNQSDARLYRTGDLARYLPDGKIELIGRIDNQVKIRGFRIELGEIEAVLAQHSAIQEIAVIAREDIPGDKRLVAYVVSQQEQPHSSKLRSFLQERLPNYMVPSVFVFLDTMPLTPNGKVDRRALPAPDASSIQLDAEFVPPSNPTEEVLATIWADILGVEQVGINDNFFELGGHSLLATRVISQLNQAFSVELSLQNIFETLTVAGLAVSVSESQVEHIEDEDIADLLAELEGLSDEEVQQILAQEMQSSVHA